MIAKLIPNQQVADKLVIWCKFIIAKLSPLVEINLCPAQAKGHLIIVRKWVNMLPHSTPDENQKGQKGNELLQDFGGPFIC